MAPVGVVLDASVLYPAALRDTLLRASAIGLYRAQWTDEILEEVRRNLVLQGRASEEQARRLVDTMHRAFPEAEVTGYAAIIERMTNHPKDRHVLAAAVTAGAEFIVTNNLRHFPREALEPFQIEAQSPDEFLIDLFDFMPMQMARIVVDQTTALRSPPATYDDVLNSIARQAPTFARLVRDVIERDSRADEESGLHV